MISTNPQLDQLLRTARIKQFPRGQILLYEGDTAPDVFVLRKGVVKIHDIDEQGNEKILHIVKAPGIMPLAFFSGPTLHTRWFYTALTDCEAYVIADETLREACLNNGKLAMHLTTWFSNEVHELLVRLSSLGKTNAQDKLVAALKYLAVCHGKQKVSGWDRVTFPVSHQLLADMVGITRESAATVMKELQDNKVVRNPKLTILEIDFKKLVKL